MILTKLFIILLTILLILEMIKYFKNKRNPVIEGATTMAMGTSGAGMGPSPNAADNVQYTDPGLGNDPLYLSKLNASNITFLKDKVDELVGLKQQLTDLSAKVDQNSTAITQMSTQLNDTANKVLNRDPNSTDPIPQATGLN
jgi:hypothetical protein